MTAIIKNSDEMSKNDVENNLVRGVSDLWNSVNHIAIVVSDVGRSLSFYTDVVGMKQVIRPNFDRHGAWLTMNNVDLHLIKGRPAVHGDDDLIVSHIAISVNDMPALRRRLKEMNVLSRKNVSVPNPADKDNGIVDQAFVRDPDGYYIEFANCEALERYIHTKTAEGEKNWNLSTVNSVLKAREHLKKVVRRSRSLPRERTKIYDGYESISSVFKKGIKVDQEKLKNLIKRRKVYGDITQNATEKELEYLLVMSNNNVPMVIAALEYEIRARGTRTFIPPAFYGRDGSFVYPPSFEMAFEAHNDAKTKLKEH